MSTLPSNDDDLPMANDIENTGNTSAASIPLAMEEMLATGETLAGFLSAHATVADGNITIDLGNGDAVTIRNLTSLETLAEAIDIA